MKTSAKSRAGGRTRAASDRTAKAAPRKSKAKEPSGEPTALYAYCLIQAERPPKLSGFPAGLPGVSPARLLAAGPRRWLVVADAPLARYSAAAIEERLDDLDWLSACAVGHEAVCEAFVAGQPTARGVGSLLPMKLFTLFSSEPSALAELRRDRPRATRLLRRLAGCAEWGVRVHFDPARRPAAPSTAGRAAPTGRAFLERKREERDAAKNAVAAARAGARRCFDALAAVAKDGHVVALPPHQPTGSLLLEANFLQPASRQREFERALQKCAEDLLALGCEVVLTGPWPPYHFLDDSGARSQ